MATGYTISLGYNNGTGFKGTDADAWRLLRNTAIDLSQLPMRIAEEATAFGAPAVDSHASLFSYAERFASDDKTFNILENRQEIFLMSSADDSGMKGHVRRAFCRLLIAHMHIHRIEVNLTVG